MRCNYCGWENPQGNVKCEKCNAPLKGSMIGGNSSNAGQANSQGGQPVPNRDSVSSNSPLRGTLNEKDAFGSNASRNGINIEKNTSKCPNCGYLVSPSMNVCPSCGCNLRTNSSNAQTQSCPSCGVPITSGAKFCSQCGRPIKPGTINTGPQVGGQFFTLRPIAWDKETVQYQPITYTGSVVNLNRSNTEPNNSSITSKLQAVISNINGEWYIEDKSSYQSTLIHIRGKVKLQDGDVIVFGNRKFEFKG